MKLKDVLAGRTRWTFEEEAKRPVDDSPIARRAEGSKGCPAGRESRKTKRSTRRFGPGPGDPDHRNTRGEGAR